jgi:hypothetical protein
MRIAIIGGRNFNDYELIDKTLEPYLNRIRCVVSGGAIGADSLGERWAKNNNVDTLIFLPDWKKYGKSAGYIRNKDIVSNSDIIFAFWDGKSKGTEHSINICKKEKKELVIVNF